MKMTKRLLAIFSLMLPAVVAQADDTTPVDTSKWKCKYCAFEEPGFTGVLDVGIGYVSDDSYKFGEYTGLNEKGAYFIGNAELRVRGEDAKYWDIDINNAGLDSRSLSIEGGRQGSYKFNLSYDELPHYITNSIATPFLGIGGDNLTLPPSWVRGVSTGTMTDLANSLHDADLQTSRKRAGIGATLIASDRWEFAVNYRHETREGRRAVGSAFFFNSAQLVMPVDYVTQQIDVSASYTGNDFQARLAYYGSLFSDNNTSLTWQNPYSSASGADSGQLALPPDNAFHQITASLGYDFSDKTRATADFAVGRMTQNQDFLPVTTNTSLTGYPFALPRTSLDGLVDTTNGKLKISSRLTPKLGMNIAYTYNDHDDKTPRAAYTWVTTDTSVNATTRTNTPYSFTQSKIKLSADYQLTGHTKLTAGIDNDTNERTYQEVSKTTENTVWAKGKIRTPGKTEVTVKLARAKRDIDSYEALPWLSPAENPLLRKYNMTDRERNLGALRVQVMSIENVSIGLGFEYANDSYTHSSVGLTSSRDFTLNADVTAVLDKKTSLYFFANHEEIDSQQAGSSTATTPDWTGENNDTIDTYGFGIKHNIIENKLDIGADINFTESVGKVTVDTGSADPGFPVISASLKSLKLYATYKLRDNLAIKGTYWLEHLESKNWNYDGVSPDTIPNLLALGQESPQYNVNVVMLSLRYKF
jgi:MtrB/PioB family decaheme-associated outer membrane protein